MNGPKVLTFNFHEPYLVLMAKTGYPITVGLYEEPPLARTWQTKFRPVPPNITFLDEKQWRADLASGRFDVVVAQNEMNAITLLGSKTPAVLVMHNRRNFLETTLSGDMKSALSRYNNLLERLQSEFNFVYISESKKKSYGMPGTVIPPGIDVEEYGGYTGETPEVLRVGNAMRSRNLMFDVDFQDRVVEGFPNRVVGEDALMPEATPSSSFDQLLSLYRSLRCLLHVTREAYEDGYNLSTLEAMACGMPVVSLANATSPISDGLDGFASGDANDLRRRIEELLGDRDWARELGSRGRETVARKFPIQAFVDRWRATLDEAAQRRGKSMRTKPDRHPKEQTIEVPRLGILMSYIPTPITTARYCETALRRYHNVVTTGRPVTPDLLEKWGFTGTPPSMPSPDILRSAADSYEAVLAKLPEGFQPNIFLWFDTGMEIIGNEVESLKMPRVCYIVDSHLGQNSRIEMAKRFNFTFVAQKTSVEIYAQAGVHNVAWLPLACSRDLHDIDEQPRNLDVAYVGAMGEPDRRRHKLLDHVRAKHPNSFIGRAWPEEMAKIYAQAKIVVNVNANGDLNMRVFEAMASGALLVTDPADGLEDLFQDGEHMVVYRNDDALLNIIQEYLADDKKRERIAAAGKQLVHEQHNYDVRMTQMAFTILEAGGALGGYQGESRFNYGGYYCAPRPELAALVPAEARIILDCGCGGGELGRLLKQRGAQEVVGIEIVEKAWRIARRNLDDALLGSVEEMELPYEDEHFDCIIFGDVLEHLVDPTAVLRKVSRVLKPGGSICISIPNVRFWQVVEMHANGRWQYEDAGIMDRTHLRFFCAPEIQAMVQNAGLEIDVFRPLSMWPPDQLPRDKDGYLRLNRVTIGPIDDAEYQDFLVYQYGVVAVKPAGDSLELARQALEAKEFEKAYELAEKARTSQPADRSIVMGLALAKLGQLDRAEKRYREALTAAPDRLDAQTELGIVLVAQNRPREAVEILERVVSHAPNDDRAQGALGLAFIAENRHEAALPRLQRSLELKFDNEPLLRQLIQCAESLQRLQVAEPALRRFVEFFPGNLDMGITYARLLLRIGHSTEARERIEMILLFAPDHAGARDLARELNG
ncbi:MAG: hypothetical protein AMXMBFR84_45980 [Candidatus Hydrogenedentota bacterium]